ncbi:MAG: hypothetical protein P8Z78_07610 [Gammaproteobacteria bacterium]
MRSKTTLTMILLVTLCLPLQALASVLLPCMHAADSVVVTEVHPCHAQSGEEPSGDLVSGECHKCQLCQMLSVSALLPQQVMPVVPGRSVYTVLPVDHFYSFLPGQLQRPPSPHTPT